MSAFIVQTASAKMPRNCWGIYRRVAVIEVAAGVEHVAMISPRARGVVRIVQTWERCNVGKGIRSAYAKALEEATKLASELNRANA